MVKRDLRLLILVAVFGSWTTALPLLAQAPPGATTPAKAAACVKWGDIPLSFEPNLGQESPRVRYLARGSTYTLYLASTEILLSGYNQSPLRMKLVGANPAPRIAGESQQVSTSNYLVGNDPGKWRTSVPNYGRARYRSVYPGIDLVYYGHDGSLEYDWIVSPSADPRRIRQRFPGAGRLRIDRQGELVIEVGQTEYRQKKPTIYQDVEGRRIEIAGEWQLHGKDAGFRIGTYDRKRPLTIDPALYYSTYLGGTSADYAYAIAVDNAGNTYVTGGTGSANFPTANPLQSSLRGSNDVFVTKINASGSARLYSTFLGSTGVDEGKGIAVNSRGEVYVTGSAGFSDFPMKNAIQATWGGSGDAFLTRLNAAGSGLVYSTYLGGNAVDYGTAIALDPAGDAYVIGITFSTNFPTVSPFQAAKGAQQDAFVAKINPAGTAWVYATYLGGNNVDEGYAIATDTVGNAYVTGYTQSTNFPLGSPFQGSNGGSVDAFVTKLNPAGSALVYSTYLGGSGTDYGTAIAVDLSGSAFVTGIAASDNFPLAHPIDATLGSHAVDDVFVTKFTPAGSALVYSTYLGGGSTDDAYAIALDRAGNAFITGRTNSTDFPLVNPIQATRVAFDMFVTEINGAGSALVFSTFLGGSASESGRGIAVDALGNIHIAGESTSTDFPVVKAVQTGSGGGQDGIVLLFATRLPYVFNGFAGNGCSGGEFLYVPSSGQAFTALTNGDGTYSYVGNVLSAGFDTLRTGDFTGDGKADLIGYNSSTAAASIGIGNGDGTFTFQSLFLSPGYDFVETGDLDGDGKTDVILYNSHTGTMYAGISKGDGTFTYTYTLISSGFSYVRLGDFTGDGTADLFLYRAADGLSFVGVGDGTGGFAFQPVFVSSGYDLADLGDLNGDGRADLLLYDSANGQAAAAISNGTGGFAFTPLVFTPGFTSVRVADYTGDGYADVTVYNKNSATAYLGTGTGTGTFTFQSLFWSPGYDYVIPEDVNCDGKTDVILYNSATGTEYSGISNGDGSFSYTYSYWGIGRALVDQNHPSAAAVAPVTVSLNRKALAFVATSTGGAFASQTGSQAVALTQTAGPAVSWTATSDKPWLVVTPGSGTGAATLNVSVAFDPSVAAAGNATGSINVVLTGAANTVGPIAVTLATVAAAAPPSIPFGSFDTPAGDGTVLAGSIAVTGWTLDNVGVNRVELWRDLQPGETTPPFASTPSDPRNGKVFISNATFVDGARPDVEALYPTTPFAYRGGWGYLLLTWGLWNQGNGTYKLYAFAFDQENNVATIGSKSIVVNNNAATRPFGSIDTPAIGGDPGTLPNFGWGLTPMVNGVATCRIPSSGVQVSIDSGPLQPVVYGDARTDIAGAFPGFSNSAAAGGHFIVDWSTLPNGTHTIGWLITDDCNRADGVGSRFFTVTTGTNLVAAPAGTVAPLAGMRISEVESDEPILIARGYGESPAVLQSGMAGARIVELQAGDHVELRLPRGFKDAWQVVGGQVRGLPLGSTWDADSGTFYWQPAPGFFGRYRLVFSNGRERIGVRLLVTPQ